MFKKLNSEVFMLPPTIYRRKFAHSPAQRRQHKLWRVTVERRTVRTALRHYLGKINPADW